MQREIRIDRFLPRLQYADDSTWCLHGYRLNVPSLIRGELLCSDQTCNMDKINCVYPGGSLWLSVIFQEPQLFVGLMNLIRSCVGGKRYLKKFVFIIFRLRLQYNYLIYFYETGQLVILNILFLHLSLYLGIW